MGGKFIRDKFAMLTPYTPNGADNRTRRRQTAVGMVMNQPDLPRESKAGPDPKTEWTELELKWN